MREALKEAFSGNSALIDEDSAASAVTLSSQEGRRTRFGLDDNGFIGSVRSPLGRQWQISSEPVSGRTTRFQSPSGNNAEFSYNSAGQFQNIAINGKLRQSFRYNSSGQLTEAAYPDASSERWLHDPAGAPLQFTSRAGSQINFTYDADGRATEVRDGNGNRTGFRYAGGPTPSEIAYPDESRDRFHFTPNKLLAGIERESGVAVDITRDQKGRIQRLEYSDGTASYFQWDSAGRMVQASTGPHVSDFDYDSEGKLIRETTSDSTVRYQYSPDGLLAAITYPTGDDVRFAYDADARLSSVIDWAGGEHKFQYPSELERTHLHPNGLRSNTRLSPAGQTLAIETIGTGSHSKDEFGYNDEDRLQWRTSDGPAKREYRYDADGQLIEVKGSRPEQFTYDKAGNRLGFGGLYNSLNQPIESEGAPVRHDANGNLAEATLNGARWTFAYDARGFLTLATSSTGLEIAYEYDAVGRRVIRREGRQVTTYVWAGEQVIREVTHTARGTASHQDHLYYPHSFTPLAVRINGSIFCCHTNPLGAPERLTDSAGREAWRAIYSAFGRATVESGNTRYALRLPGQWEDSATGLHYNRFRYYSPELGRYLSRDPLGYTNGLNLYLYAGNDPINGADPLGLAWWKTALSIAAGIAVAAAVIALAPIAAPAALIVAGIAAGAVGMGLNEALNEKKLCGACIGMAMLKGAAVGALTALPFLAVPAAAGVAAFAAAGGASGGIGYAAETAMTPGAHWNWGAFATAVGLGVVTAGAARFIHGRLPLPERTPATTAALEEPASVKPPAIEAAPPAPEPVAEPQPIPEETPATTNAKAANDPNRPLTKDPIDCITGEVCVWKTDFILPGALPLTLERCYTSAQKHHGHFGPRWASTWSQYIEEDGRSAVGFFAGDGRWIRFNLKSSSTGWVENPDVAHFGLRKSAAGYEVRDPARRILRFTAELGVRYLLSAIEDPNGHSIRFTYGEDGALRRVDHSGGYQLAVEGTATQIRRITLLNGGSEPPLELIRYEYDAQGQLTSVIDGSGLPFRYFYDSAARITRWEDRNGTWYDYQYDSEGRCIHGVGSEGLYDCHLAYDPNRRATTVTDSTGASTVYFYNTRQQLTMRRNARGGVTRTTWDERSHKLRETDPAGRSIAWEYNAESHLTQVVDGLGRTTRIAYNGSGLPEVLTDAAGQTWRRRYDPQGNLIEARGPDGSTWRYERDHIGNLSRLIDPAGHARRFGYDQRGLLLWADDPQGNRLLLVRDALGRVVERTDALGRTTQFTYNQRGKLAEVTLPDQSQLRWEYDAEGNLLRRVGADGKTFTYRYGAFDLLAEVEKPSGAKLKLTYDAEARLTQVENELGRLWNYEHNATGEVIREIDFHGRIQEFDYDRSGLCTRRTNGLGHETLFSYDAAGQLTSKAGAAQATFAYDSLGRIQIARNANTEVRIERDAFGRPLQEWQDGRVLESSYDPRGLRTKRKTAAGECEWTWNANGQPAELKVDGGELLQFVHDAAGRPVERRMRGGLVLKQQFDVLDRIASQWAGNEAVPEIAALVERGYSYDRNGDPVEIRDTRWGVSRFTYEIDGRISKAERSTGPSEEFRYDLAGNIAETASTLRIGLQTRFYTKEGRLERAGETQYFWDDDGRLEEKRENGRRWKYEWTPEGRLQSVRTPEGERWQYQYDAFGRRVNKSGKGQTTAYLWDGAVIAEEIQGESKTSEWVHEPGTFRPILKRQSGTDYHCITDQVGTPRELLSQEGEVAWSAELSTWGDVEERSTQQTGCPIRFQGQWHDEESGLHYNFNRYYEPDTGQYLTSDPIGLLGGTRSYGYVHNPLSWVDPLGLAGCVPEDPATQRLRQRADEYQSVLDPRAQNGRTVAALETNGPDVIGGGVRDLDPMQRALKSPNEMLAKLKGEHAEVTVLTKARTEGLSPKMLGTSRDICPDCQEFIKNMGGTISGPRSAVWEE